MKERPILFSGEMVRAILDGRKTQTRRLIKPQPEPLYSKVVDHFKYSSGENWRLDGWYPTSRSGVQGAWKPDHYRCPYGISGDRLWVRETWNLLECYGTEFGGAPYEWDIYEGKIPKKKPQSPYTPGYDFPHSGMLIGYCATSEDPETDGPWRPSIHMPRWASRITLEVTDVRVERVRSITENAAYAEGIGLDPRLPHPIAWFRDLWDYLYSSRGLGWDANPWVWVIEFRRIKP